MDGIFISYRRDDSAPYAGRLYDHLIRSFPGRRVFMDIDAIDAGEDFVDAINKTLDSSKVVITIIGKNWLTAKDSDGNLRLENPDDYVRREVGTALRSHARVIPVLVAGASMPRSEALPDNLALLARRNAIELSDTRFTTDAERLVAAIKRVVEGHDAHSATPTAQPASQTPIDPARRSLTSTPSRVSWLVRLLWASFGLGVISSLTSMPALAEGEGAVFFVVMQLMLGLAVWIILAIAKGKNWARLAYLALTSANAIGFLYEIERQGSFEVLLNLVMLGLDGYLIYLMFSKPITTWFESGH